MIFNGITPSPINSSKRSFEQIFLVLFLHAIDVNIYDINTFSGSTRHLFDDNIEDEELIKYLPYLNDYDVKILNTQKDHILDLQIGKKYFDYLLVDKKRSGSELHVLVENSYGLQHQIDFEFVEDFKSFNVFAHSSSWEDCKLGIKGVHHKLLLNSIGLDKYKFSILKGIGSREMNSWRTQLDFISLCLFGKQIDISSFNSLCKAIKYHPRKKEIYEKFEKDVTKTKIGTNNVPALELLHKVCFDE